MKKLINILFFLVTAVLFVSCGGEKVPEDMLGEYYIDTQMTEYQSDFTKAKALVEKKGNKYHITLESNYYSGGRTYISRPPVKAELSRKETLEIVAKVKKITYEETSLWGRDNYFITLEVEKINGSQNMINGFEISPNIMFVRKTKLESQIKKIYGITNNYPSLNIQGNTLIKK